MTLVSIRMNITNINTKIESWKSEFPRFGIELPNGWFATVWWVALMVLPLRMQSGPGVVMKK